MDKSTTQTVVKPNSPSTIASHMAKPNFNGLENILHLLQLEVLQSHMTKGGWKELDTLIYCSP